MHTIRIIAITAATLVALTAAPALAVGGEGQTWPAFTESSACGAQRIPTPHADETGWLARSDLLRGEFAAYFGRSVQQIHSEVVRWEMPDSKTILAVHPWTVPALDAAAASIEGQSGSNGPYRVTPDTTYSTASRTIAGSIRISRHTYGTAFDVNANRNPYRGDNKLITNLPEWWTQSFLDAGFCWGGLWIGSKDTMHFAWQGPAFSGYTSLPLPYEPLTDEAPFSSPDRIFNVTPSRTPAFATMLADTSNNGALNVVRLRTDGAHLLVDSSLASRRHNACASRTSVIPNLAAMARDAVAVGFGDWDGRGGHDLYILEATDSGLSMLVRWAFGGFAAEVTSQTSVPVPSPGAWISTGDFDVDGNLDLVIIDGPTMTVWDVDPNTGAAQIQVQTELPFEDTGDHYSLADLDLDNIPDLWQVAAGQLSIALGADGWNDVIRTERLLGLPRDAVDIAATDYDGDGRPDVVAFDGSRKLVWLGNTPMPDGQGPEVWFESDEPECREGEQSATRDELRFTSSGWVSEGSYEWRRANGFSVGCNPEKDDCAIEFATHRMFAEFLAWIDGLEPVGTDPDTAAGRAVAMAGYEPSCAPDDRECWDSFIAPAELSARFGVFLAVRRDTGFEPHRWIIPTANRYRSDSLPR